MANVSITAKTSILDIAGNPLVQAVDNSQTVDTQGSVYRRCPDSHRRTITDADANGDGGPSTLSVSFTFNEAMDTNTDPTVSFDPAVASTLTESDQQGAWQADGKTFKVMATVADAGIDVDAVTIDITGAKDAAGNLQVDHTATVGSGSRYQESDCRIQL